MPPIEIGPLRSLSAIESRLARQASDSKTQSAKAEASVAAVVQSEVLDAGDMPVDFERVKMIREAVEQGTYPILPAKIADAMIAAGYLLRSGK